MGGRAFHPLFPLFAVDVRRADPLLPLFCPLSSPSNSPSNFTATSYHDNNSTLGISYQRPICQYPKYPVYKSTAGGDEKNASSFACEL